MYFDAVFSLEPQGPPQITPSLVELSKVIATGRREGKGPASWGSDALEIDGWLGIWFLRREEEADIAAGKCHVYRFSATDDDDRSKECARRQDSWRDNEQVAMDVDAEKGSFGVAFSLASLPRRRHSPGYLMFVDLVTMRIAKFKSMSRIGGVWIAKEPGPRGLNGIRFDAVKRCSESFSSRFQQPTRLSRCADSGRHLPVDALSASLFDAAAIGRVKFNERVYA